MLQDMRIASLALPQSYEHSESALPCYFLMFVQSSRSCKISCKHEFSMTLNPYILQVFLIPLDCELDSCLEVIRRIVAKILSGL